MQRTEDQVEFGCISSCCSKDDHRGDVDHIVDEGCDVDHTGYRGGDVDHIGDGDFNDVN